MRIPKTPVEFDYDLWTTEDGKCMVRVKATGETTEVDRAVMKALRNEEKRLRRSYGASGSSDMEDEDSASGSVLSLDAMPDDDVNASAWLADPENNIELAETRMAIDEFRNTLTPIQLYVFDQCLLGGKTIREFSQEHQMRKSTVWDMVDELRKKFQKNF